VYPFTAPQSFSCTPSLLGLQQQADQEVSELCGTWNTRLLSKSYGHPLGQHTGKPIPNNSLTQGECSTGLTTCFFKPKPPRIYRVTMIQGYNGNFLLLTLSKENGGRMNGMEEWNEIFH
jgi:hypothetical protein